MRSLVLGSLVSAVLLTTGCVSTTGRPGGREAAAPRDVEARLAALEREAKVAEVELRRLRVQVAELQAALESTGPAVREAPRETTPPARPVVDSSESVESTDLVLDDRAPIEGAVRTRPPDGDRAPGPAAAAAPAGVDDAAQALYDRGYTLYHQQRYVDAETAFQRFLQANAETDLADNALYWIGESRFARNDLRGALAAFDETVERFPTGNKVPDALLKAGDCLEKLGDRERARAAFQQILQRFPASAAAERAREHLERLQ